MDSRTRLGIDIGRLTSRRSSRRRALRVLLLLGMITIGLATFLLAGTWILLDPTQIRLRVDGILSERLGPNYTVGSVGWSGFGVLALDDFRIPGPDESQFEHLVAIDRLELDLDLANIIARDGNPIDGIVIERPRIYVEEIDGRIPLFKLLDSEERSPRTVSDLPRVQVENLEIHICPLTLFRTEDVLRVDRFTLDLLEDRRYAFEGRGSHPIFGALKLEGSGSGGRFEGHLDLSRVAINDQFIDGFPDALENYLDRIEPVGLASTLIGFEFDSGKLVDWDAIFRLREGRLTVTDPPIDIEAIHGRVEITPRRRGPEATRLLPEKITTLSPISGLAWGGEAEIRGQIRFDVSPDGASIVDRTLSLELRDVQLGERTRDVLKLGGEPFEALADPSTEGRIDLELAWLGPRGRFEPRRVVLDEVRSTSTALPFPVDEVNGRIEKLGEDEYDIDLSLESGSMRVTATGQGGWEAGSPIDLDLNVRGLPIDDELRSALGDVGERIWSQWQPGGVANIDVALQRGIGEPDTDATIEFRLSDGRMRFFRFPLAIESIEGKGRLDLKIAPDGTVRPSELTMKRVYGRNGISNIAMELGTVTWPEDDPPRIDLTIESPNLVADEAVYTALPDIVADTLRKMNLVGILGTKVRIFHPERTDPEAPTKKLDVVVENRIVEPLLMQSDLFPYPMTILFGETEFRLRDQILELKDLRTDPEFGPSLTFDGLIQFDRQNLYDPKAGGPPPSAPYDLRVRIGPGYQIKGIRLENDDFVDALPKPVARLFEAIEAKGAVTGDFDVHYWPGRKADGSPLHHVEYSGRLRVEDGSMRVGLSLSEIETDFELFGSGGNADERPLPIDFAIRIGSQRTSEKERTRKGRFRFNTFRIRDVDALVLFGRPLENLDQIVASTKGEQKPGGGILFDPFFRPRLAPGQINSTIQVHVPSAKLYTGDLNGLFFVDVQRDDFAGHYGVNGMDLRVAATDLFQSPRNATGTSNGEVLFYGDRRRLDSIRGQGRFDIADGNLGQLPIAQSILSDPTFLQLLFGGGALRRTITKAHCRFDIQANRFVVRQFEDFRLVAENNDYVSGRGFMTFDRQIDLYLRPAATLIPEAADVFFEKRFRGTLEDLTGN